MSGLVYEEWRKQASQGRLEEAIFHYVAANDWTIWPDLVTDLKPYHQTEGKIEFRLSKNRVLWGGLSSTFTEAIVALLRSKRLELTPISRSVYVLSGCTLPDLPTVAYAKNGSEPTARSWVPVCFRVNRRED